MAFKDLKDLFGARGNSSSGVLTPEEDIDTVDGEDAPYHTITTPYPVDGDEVDGEGIDEEEDERVMAQSSIKVANYDTYSLANLTEVILLVREGYTVFISYETLVAKYRSMNLDKTEVEIKAKTEINQFCNALLGAKLALDATFEKLGEFTYIFAPDGVDVAKIKGEASPASSEEE